MLHGRKISDQSIDVWVEIFREYRPEALIPALKAVKANADRMPSPGMLSKELNRVIDEKPWLGRYWKDRLKAIEGHDSKGVPCKFWSDDPRTPAYLAKNCAEGRVFVALLEDIAKRKSIPSSSMTEAELARERARQKAALASGNPTAICPDCRKRMSYREFMKHTCPQQIERLKGREN